MDLFVFGWLLYVGVVTSFYARDDSAILGDYFELRIFLVRVEHNEVFSLSVSGSNFWFE